MILLIVEGLFRKLAPGGLSILIFFFKDFLLGYSLIQLFRIRSTTDEVKGLYNVLQVLLGFFIPLLIIHGFYDPVLVPWGLKQYIFYAVAGIILVVGFVDNEYEDFTRYLKLISYFIIPTVIVALVQLQLPAGHWLNSSVNDEDVSRFAAAGFLRVSSTFSFTGQFSYFLQFICTIIFSRMYFPDFRSDKNIINSGFKKAIPLICLLFLILGVFSTGGRTAVFGVGVVFAMGLFFSLFKNQSFVVQKSIIPVLGLLSLLLILPIFRPDAFAAYTKRAESDYRGQSNVEEIQNRVFGAYIEGFRSISEKDNLVSFFFGDGLGVMTNGVDQISSYAARIRANIWTETDFYTTAWEGGVYLLLVWYGFRIYMVFYCFRRWNRIKNRGLSMSASFFLGYVTLIGLIGTLSLQAPIAIYWWTSIGVIILLHHFDRKFQYENSET